MNSTNRRTFLGGIGAVAASGLAMPALAQAKAKVETFIKSLGMRPMDVGDLEMAHWLEGAGLLTVGLANHGVGNFDFALSITELPVSANG